MWTSKRGPQESPSYAAQVPSTAPVASGIPSAAGLLAPPVEIRGPTVYELELAPKAEISMASESFGDGDWSMGCFEIVWVGFFEWDFLNGLVGDRLKIFENSDWYSVGFNGISLGFHGIEWPLGFRWEIEHQESRDFIRFKLDVDIMRYNNQLTIIHHHNSPY